MTDILNQPDEAQVADTQADETQAGEELKSFFYDLATIPAFSIEDQMGDSPERDLMFETFGRDLLTKTIVHSPKLSVFHEVAKPHERVRPHRHGTHQLTYVLRGELIYGKQVTSAGMGRFQPDILYSWRAGAEGAEWLEIHAGLPTIIVPPARHHGEEQEDEQAD